MTNDNGIDFAKLIPELPKWNNGRGISVEAWVGCTGNFELAIGYSRLFWPDFVEHDGCIFFGDVSVESYRSFMERCKGDRQRVEAVMNHRHVFDYFAHANGSATREQIVYLGGVIRSIWQTKLVRDFPNRAFAVSFPKGPFEDLVEYEVTFWQVTSTNQQGI
jgi:hypothetical protein